MGADGAPGHSAPGHAPPGHGAPSKGAPRRRAILALARPLAQGIVVDVGCDHGYVAAALGAIGSERRSGRLPRRDDIRLVVADGLRPYRRVDLAIIAGMGPAKILEILRDGPRPAAAVLHTPQHPHALREGLAAAGWRIDDERLAPENGRFAEVLLVRPGEETARGYALRFGPRLIASSAPEVEAHARQLRGWWAGLAAQVPAGAPKRAEAEGWVAWLDALIARRQAGASEG